VTATAHEQLAFAGPAALAELVRSRQAQPRELVELFMRRIEELNPRLNAFRVTMAEQALAEADALREPDGPLAGVPIAVKDDLPVAGQAMTRGSRSYGPPGLADGEALRRLRAAGATPIGITNVPELMIYPWTASDANGITRNPWDRARTPGGSSGGSAAAVAAGMVPAATGSDGGGSIRIPSACCGLVGMKPTRGRVSTQPAAEHWLGLSVYGALARTVRDSALLLDVMQGAVAGDRDSAPPPERPYVDAVDAPPSKLRIAVSRKLPAGVFASISAEQRSAWEQTARVLEELGHEVVQRDPAYGMIATEFTQSWTRGIYEEWRTVPARCKLECATRQMAAAGRVMVPARRRAKIRVKRTAAAARVLALWDEVDLLLTPALATTAIAAEGGYGRSALAAFNIAGRFTPWTAAFNVTGQPAVSIPAGLGSDGLPLSVQLVARPCGEDTLYSLAAQLEAARPWVERRPPVGGASG